MEQWTWQNKQRALVHSTPFSSTYLFFAFFLSSIVIPLSLRHILSGRDALAVMPTGAGKSVCYQVPGIVLDGLTLVVSPLVSLMGDQVRALLDAGVRGAYLNSTLTPGQQATVLRRALAGAYQIMYVAPERLSDPRFLAFAREAALPLVAVDEAHCVSQWGQELSLIHI